MTTWEMNIKQKMWWKKGREKEVDAPAQSNWGKSTHKNHYLVFSDLLFNHMHWNVYADQGVC